MGGRYCDELKEGALASLMRIVLGRWIIALVAFALVAAPQHAGAVAMEQQAIPSHHSSVAVFEWDNPGHQHASPMQDHATARACCQAACIMALPLLPKGEYAPVVSSALLPMTRDIFPPPATPPGIDRPPKFS